MVMATADTRVAITAGVNLGAKETRGDMFGNRQKSHGKYNPIALDTNSIYTDSNKLYSPH